MKMKNMDAPVTSMSLIRVLGADAESPRWTEFANKYAAAIEGFLCRYFPTVDAQEVFDETLLALVKQLPLYEYDPDEKGHFHNYLIGIVRYKAIEQLRRQKRVADLKTHIKDQAFEWTYRSRSYKADLSDWQRDAYESALQQFFANPNVSTRDKEIFKRIIQRGERPEDVAGTNPFDETDRLSVWKMAEEKGYEGYLKFTFLANQGRSYTIDTAMDLQGTDWRQTVFIDAANGAEESRLNTSATKAAAYRTVYVLKEGVKQQFWKLKVE